MSSIRSSLDEFSVMVACTRMNPCSTRSLSKTRTTPMGILTRAAHSATERRSHTSSTASAAALTLVPALAGSSRKVASMGRSTVAWVRPDVMVYGRTKRGLLTSSSEPSDSTGATACHASARRTDAGLGLDGLSDALDEQRHLVTDLADVGILLRQDSEVGAVTHAHEHEVAVLHLHDGLEHCPAVEEAGSADSQARKTG